MRVFAYDIDDGENARLTYMLHNSDPVFEQFFRIDNKTGVIYLKKSLKNVLFFLTLFTYISVVD